MTLFGLTAMIFLVSLGLSISGMYFLLVAPASRRKMRARLSAIQQSSSLGEPSEQMALVREELLSQIPAVNRIFLRIPALTKLQIMIQQAAMDITVSTLLLMSIGLALLAGLVGLVIGMPELLIYVAAAGFAVIPFFVVSFKRQRRFARFEELFPNAVELLARAVRAGHAFTTGLELIGKEMPEPLATEFRITYEQQSFGLPLRDALHNLTVRVPTSDTRFFVSALQIQRESGGNLAEILDNLSFVIRERFKILRQVRVFTAQGRITLWLLTLLPPITAFLMYLTNPAYIRILIDDPLGHKFVAAAVVLQGVGFLVIRKIVRIKV